ncbi:hypothetical protein PWG71_25525 [Nocardiopsis sp. N85]|uniref:hypothetical protein n=1 Tax=Nocardiopsis sp. N85 TaxID=3029400 RepID=UPI00237F2E6E|nr:hypothetical protein [Nocardiopsis sp. N85]MDE3724761.1 hypothetical protein [Nocardiopsis sp. N85]
MRGEYAETADEVFVPAAYPDPSVYSAHVLEQRGDRVLICWISYPRTGSTQEVSADWVFTTMAAARAAH